MSRVDGGEPWIRGLDVFAARSPLNAAPADPTVGEAPRAAATSPPPLDPPEGLG
jgi:hypothetical protein